MRQLRTKTLSNTLFFVTIAFLTVSVAQGAYGNTQLVRGHVLTRDGRPIPGLVVSVASKDYRTVPAITQTDGSYLIDVPLGDSSESYLEVYWGNDIMYRKPFSLPMLGLNDNPEYAYPNIYLDSQNPSADQQASSVWYIQVYNQGLASGFTAAFLDPKGTDLRDYQVDTQQNLFLLVPDTASYVQFSKAGATSDRFPLTKAGPLQVFSVVPKADGSGFTIKAETLAVAQSNSSGWISAGRITNGVWRSEFLDLKTNGLPQPGQTAKVTRLIDLRAQPNPGPNWNALLKPEQRVKVLQVQSNSSGSNSWLRVQVLQ